MKNQMILQKNIFDRSSIIGGTIYFKFWNIERKLMETKML